MRILIALAALCGVFVSVLALRVHYSQDSEPCNINEHWDCGIVNHSDFAVVHGVPVALIGILGYSSLFVLSLARRNRVLFAGSLLGFLYALSLTRIEAHILRVWCLYCVLSQGIITVLLLLSGLAWFLDSRDPRTHS